MSPKLGRTLTLGDTMDLSEYQRLARDTSQLRLGGPQGAIAPMLGLASETGSILNVYKKYLRDGIDLSANVDFLREELGDLLWYAAAIATACGLDFNEIAQANLERTRDRYLSQTKTSDWRVARGNLTPGLPQIPA